MWAAGLRRKAAAAGRSQNLRIEPFRPRRESIRAVFINREASEPTPKVIMPGSQKLFPKRMGRVWMIPNVRKPTVIPLSGNEAGCRQALSMGACRKMAGQSRRPWPPQGNRIERFLLIPPRRCSAFPYLSSQSNTNEYTFLHSHNLHASIGE